MNKLISLFPDSFNIFSSTKAHLKGFHEYHGGSAGKNEKLTQPLSCMYIIG